MSFKLKFYGVRNQEGKWFRSKGYGGHGENWVDNLSRAKLYGKIGPARAVVSYYYNNYKEFGCPEIVVFELSEVETLNEFERVKAMGENKKKREILIELKDSERRLRQNLAEIETLKEKAKKESEKLGLRLEGGA